MEKRKKARIKRLFERNGYVMKMSELEAKKVYHNDLKALLNEDIIEKIKHGYYQWVDGRGDSDIVTLKKLFPDAIYCMETACLYYRYTDRTPNQWNFVISNTTSKTRIDINYPFIKVYRMEPKLLSLGKIKYEIDGIEVDMYDRDRTVCDILRHAENLDKEIFNKVIINYVNDPKKNIANLMKYAKILRVTKKVEQWIGVWM